LPLDYHCQFTLLALISRNSPYSPSSLPLSTILENIQRLPDEKPFLSCPNLRILYLCLVDKFFSNKKAESFFQDLKNKYKELSEAKHDHYNKMEAEILKLPKDQHISFKLYITPNTHYFELERGQTSRILRLYQNKEEKFLKVNFASDNMNKLFYLTNSAIIDKMVRPTLEKGIRICNKMLHFCGYSNSQLKSHSIWFYECSCPEEAELILFEIGKFTDPKPSKNASRRGLLFTTTTKGPKPENFIPIEDKKVQGKVNGKATEWVFTDGIGKMSMDIAIACKDALKINYDFPSAFQIRCGGIKGVLAFDPDLKEKGTVCYRPSQKKFISDFESIDICNAAKYGKGILDRQIILLLKTLFLNKKKIKEENEKEPFSQGKIKKVEENSSPVQNQIDEEKKSHDDEEFIKPEDKLDLEMLNLQKELIESFDEESLGNSSNAIGRHIYCSELQMLFYSLSSLGFPLHKDIFLYSCFTYSKMRVLNDMVQRGRMLDPDSARLMGVIDEWDVLGENEVFVQICKPERSSREIVDYSSYQKLKITQIIESDVLVTKNPCLFPGDIRRLRAVNHPKLKHLSNVIVFPAKGPRPITTMISGGDLDGDLYFVS